MTAVSIVLAACGGGDGDGSEGNGEPTVPLNEGNAVDASAETAKAIESLIGTGEFAGLGALSTQDAAAFSLPGLVQRELDRVQSRVKSITPSEGFSPLVVIEESEACDGGGSLTVRADVANEDDIQPGDTVWAEFFDCVDFFFGAEFDGSFHATIVSVGDTSLAADTTFESFTTQFVDEELTAEVDGDMLLEIVTNAFGELLELEVSGDFLMSSVSLEGEVTELTLRDYDVREVFDRGTFRYAITGAGSLESSVLDGRVDFVIVNPLEGDFDFFGEQNPDTGDVLIHGAGGSTVQIHVFNSVEVEISTDEDGDGTVDDVKVVLWEDILAEDSL